MKQDKKMISLALLLITIITMVGCSQKMLIPEDGILKSKSLYEIHKMRGRFVSYEEYQTILHRQGRLQ